MDVSHGRRTRRVVVGVSGSRASVAALMFAAEEARLRRAALDIVTVHDPTVPRRAPYAQAAERAALMDVVDDEAVDKAIAMLPDPEVARRVQLSGRVARVLIHAAEGADLLVIGRGLSSDVLGPTARACVSAAACPVTVVSPDFDEAPRRPATAARRPAYR